MLLDTNSPYGLPDIWLVTTCRHIAASHPAAPTPRYLPPQVHLARRSFFEFYACVRGGQAVQQNLLHTRCPEHPIVKFWPIVKKR